MDTDEHDGGLRWRLEGELLAGRTRTDERGGGLPMLCIPPAINAAREYEPSQRGSPRTLSVAARPPPPSLSLTPVVAGGSRRANPRGGPFLTRRHPALAGDVVPTQIVQFVGRSYGAMLVVAWARVPGCVVIVRILYIG
jgi:hypothetical protein